MVSKGLRDHGWTYINIDDAWQGIRSGPDTALQANEKFPDIKGMMDRYSCSSGLKVGLYSTPYIASYAGFIGASSDYPAGGETQKLFVPSRQPYSRIAKYRFERNDARQMAAWGTDFLKYDWRIDVLSGRTHVGSFKKIRPGHCIQHFQQCPFQTKSRTGIGSRTCTALVPTSRTVGRVCTIPLLPWTGGHLPLAPATGWIPT